MRVSHTILADNAEILVGKGRYRFENPKPDANAVLVPPLSSVPVRSGQPDGANAPAPCQAVLVERIPGQTVRRIELAAPECWIGSDPACFICRADDPFVEPRHVRLWWEDDGSWHAQHNKTTNGLWLKVPQVLVETACSFQIGEQRFRLTHGGGV